MFDLMLNEVYFHNDVIRHLGIVAVIFLPYEDVADHANKIWPKLISKRRNPISKALVVHSVTCCYFTNLFESGNQISAELLLEFILE